MSSIHAHSERWARSEAAGRALFLIEHPHAHPTTWESVDQEVRDWWTDRAQPITDAVEEAAA